MTTDIGWVRNPDGSKGETLNPTTGCTKISPGCKNCYAVRMAKRLKAMGMPQYQSVVNGNGWTGQIEFVESTLEKPLHWKKPRMIFVNSMSDLFHKNVSIEWQTDIFEMMAKTPHTYQVLTKRASLAMSRMIDIGTGVAYRLGKQREPGFWPLKNVWLGVSVENQNYLDRIDHLRETEAAVKFLSLEPLLGPLPNLNLSGIDWVIVGGETGPGAREIRLGWVRDIRDQCLQAEIPFFFKAWGASHPGGRIDGREWKEMPHAQDIR